MVIGNIDDNDNFYLDLVGFITTVWKNTSQGTKREYFEIKFKTGVDQYTNIKIMKIQNPGITEEHLKALQSGAVPVKISKVYKTTSGSVFFNSFRGSMIEENATVNFKLNDNACLLLKDIKTRVSGTFTVKGCIKWLTEENVKDTKRLREAIFYDGTGDIKLTLWGTLLDIDIEEQIQWYQLTEVNLRSYFGVNLSTSFNTTLSKCEGESLDWGKVDVEFYRLMIKDRQAMFNKKICCQPISNASIEISTCCSNTVCQQRLVVVPGELLVHCMSCNRRMTPDQVNLIFECVLECDGVTLTLPKLVFSEFLDEDVMSYKDNIDPLFAKLLYLKNVDFCYNPNKKVITKMTVHDEE